MKKIILSLSVIFFLFSCTNDNYVKLDCISDKTNPFIGGRERISATIDGKKITTSNNYFYDYCGDSETFILGGQDMHGDRCSDLIEDIRAPFMMNKKTGELTFVWVKKNDYGGVSGEYVFSGQCNLDHREIKKRTVTVKTGLNNDIPPDLSATIKK